MSVRSFPTKCGECREREVFPETLDTYSTSMDHDGRSYFVSVSNFEVTKCRNCGAVSFGRDGARRLSDALRSTAKLLQPEAIRAYREAFGLTQKELARYLQISEGALSRWETGAQIQQRCMDAFLRVFFGVEEARHFLGMAAQSVGYSVSQPATFSWTFSSVLYQGVTPQSVAVGKTVATATVINNPPGPKLRLAG
jgi:putative zinc finger/helix-turn-helix YgiT family protein